MVLGKVFIEDPERADDGASLVGEQLKGDAVLGGELAQPALMVIADRKERDAGGIERAGDPLQLDQLRLAIGSPPRAAVEHDDRTTFPACVVQVHEGAVLVGETDIGKGIADARAGIAVVTHGRHRHTVAAGADRTHRAASRSPPAGGSAALTIGIDGTGQEE
ncbi:MAG TPA: hypothetical protein VGS17_07515 [Candidatus Limnocylindria bacterium]|nr:hypothetical protein [Candidatus Limnocylindria bacterium]